MAKVTHHEKPYDEGTKTKLLIYKSYLQAWMQVFLHSERMGDGSLRFYDFFSGPGQDPIGNLGSPLLLIDELIQNRGPIFQKGYTPHIYFNDKTRWKIDQLKNTCQKKGLPWEPMFDCLDFADSFDSQIQGIGKGPSLVFIDQFGLKHVTKERFQQLIACSHTDFLFFVASSFKNRFKDLLAPEIQISNAVPHYEVHREIARQYQEWAPKGYYIGHFSIMKGSNIYGLIFGSRHWLGMLKFLHIAWKLDGEAGEADYQIETEVGQGDLFTGTFKRSKLDMFREQLKAGISSGLHKFDGDVVMACIQNGILPSKAAQHVYKELKNEGIILNKQSNQLRYSDKAVKEPREILLNGR